MTYERKGMVIRKPDIFTRTYHHAARDVQRILPSRQHSRQPIQRRAALAPAHALVQRRDHVIATVPGAVIRG